VHNEVKRYILQLSQVVVGRENTVYIAVAPILKFDGYNKAFLLANLENAYVVILGSTADHETCVNVAAVALLGLFIGINGTVTVLVGVDRDLQLLRKSL